MTQKPLMLKDYLELDWNSESTAAGFHSSPRRADGRATTVRFLLEAELRGCGRRKQPPLPQTRSMRAMRKISALFNAAGFLPFAGSEGVSSRSFWRKRGKEEKMLKVEVTVPSRSLEEIKAVEDRVSFDLPSPVVSSCSGCSESDSFASDFLPSSVASSDPSDDVTAGEDNKDSPRCSPIRGPDERIGAGMEAGVSAAVHCREAIEEEKQQLSPVSVMDFPSEEEEDDEDDKDEEESSSPSFQNNLAKLERTKLQLLQKIRRFECLANLTPFDLDRHFASSDCDDLSEYSAVNDDGDGDAPSSREEEDDGDKASREKKARGLLRQVKASCHSAVQGSVEKLLVDFFVEGLRCSGDDSSLWQVEPSEQPLLQAAREWVERARRGEVDEDCDGEATQVEMGRDERWRWSVEEEEEEVGAEVEGLLLGSLMEELLADVMS